MEPDHDLDRWHDDGRAVVDHVPSPAESRFAGWWRRNTFHPWERVVTAATDDEAHRLLFQARQNGGDFLVAIAGHDPNVRARRAS